MKLLWLSLVLMSVAQAGDPLAAGARSKLDAMTEERLQPGSHVHWNLAELNAYVHEEAVEQLPPGVRDTRVALGNGMIDAYATVDFARIAQAEGKALHPAIAKLIEGDRPLKLSLRVDSRQGRITIFLTGIEINGVALSGAPLNLLLQTFFLAYHPNAHINEPFDLDFGLDRVEVTPQGITAYRR